MTRTTPDPQPSFARTPAALLPLALVLVSSAAAASASGCDSARGEQPSPATAASANIAASVASRTVFADELLWEFGPEVRARVIAVSPMADDGRYSTVSGRWQPELPRLGTNPAQLLTLAPGLVIMASFSAPEYRAALEGKVELLVVDGFDGFDSYLRNVTAVGEALGHSERASELSAAFNQRRAALEAQRPPPETWPTAISWGHGYVAAAHTTFDDAARTAGFVNLAAREGVEGHARLDIEQLVVWDPRWLVIGCGDKSCASAIAELAERPGVAKLSAVVEGRVIAIEAPYLSTTGSAMLELSARMQARLHEAEVP